MNPLTAGHLERRVKAALEGPDRERLLSIISVGAEQVQYENERGDDWVLEGVQEPVRPWTEEIGLADELVREATLDLEQEES